MSTLASSPRAAAIAQWFESLTPQSLSAIGQVYADKAHFRDPFNDVCGVESVRRIYAHMFDNLGHPRFVVTEIIEQGSRVFMVWSFHFDWRGQAFDVEGATRFELDADGRILSHQDYWDVAAGVYEKLPLLGRVLAWLRRRMSA